MQTFLPFPSFERSAGVLDSQRLGNQCYRECLTLYYRGWPNHPAARMWRRYEYAFCDYAWWCAWEMYKRGGWAPGVATKWMSFWIEEREKWEPLVPVWLGDERLHLSHQANLVRKDHERYSELFPGVEPMDGYWWPKLDGQGGYELYFKRSV